MWGKKYTVTKSEIKLIVDAFDVLMDSVDIANKETKSLRKKLEQCEYERNAIEKGANDFLKDLEESKERNNQLLKEREQLRHEVEFLTKELTGKNEQVEESLNIIKKQAEENKKLIGKWNDVFKQSPISADGNFNVYAIQEMDWEFKEADYTPAAVLKKMRDLHQRLSKVEQQGNPVMTANEKREDLKTHTSLKEVFEVYSNDQKGWDENKTYLEKSREALCLALCDASGCWDNINGAGVFLDGKMKGIEERLEKEFLGLPHAIAVLTHHLKTDPEYRSAWVANISVPYQDRFKKEIPLTPNGMKYLCDQAAEAFIFNLCQ